MKKTQLYRKFFKLRKHAEKGQYILIKGKSLAKDFFIFVLKYLILLRKMLFAITDLGSYDL